MATLKSRRIVPSLLLIVIVGAIALHFTPLGKSISGVGDIVLNPIRAWFYEIGSGFSVPMGDLSSAEEEQLRQSVTDLVVENAHLKSRLLDLEQLQSELEQIALYDYPLTVGRITGRSLDGTRDTLTVNRGSSNGLRVGEPVVAGAGVLIGTLMEVRSRSATILLVTDAQSSLSAEVQNETRSPGVVEGSLGRTAELRLVPQDELIEPAMTVVTAGIEDHVPPGIVIGVIGDSISEDQEVFQTATLRLPVEYPRVTIVTILHPGGEL